MTGMDEEGGLREIRSMALLMAHDLRNMFSVLNGLVILVERRNEPRHLEMMKKQLDLCEQVVSSFVRLAEEGRSVRGSISLGPLISALVESMHFPENVVVELSPGLSGNALCDPGQIRQILWNLLANAADACGTEPACVRVSTQEKDGFVCIQVEDTGQGISPEVREHLMERPVTTKTAGMGLGLYLSRRMAETNGGRLEFESREGPGTRFSLWLPEAKS